MIAIALVFILLGVLIKYAKMHFLLAGYNTMPKEEKAKYDIEGIASVFRNGMFGMALIVLLGYGISLWLENPAIKQYALWTSMIIGLPYLLILSNSKKYRISK